MRKLILLFLLSGTIFAQDFSGIRIYINPGHGGHDSDDRYIAETGFWESESNLSKGLHLRDMLLSMNATVKISRTTNTTADDLPLSVIDADANNFDADFFHSIHSNGFNGTSNYTVVFYKELSGSPVFPLARTMSDIMKDHLYKVNRTTAAYARGDYSFLGFNLGVLRTLNMPGTLSEGSFHDYIPESFRLRNTYYHKHEAWAIVRSLIDYFNLTDISDGIIAGIVRDPFQDVSYYSISGTNDDKKPVNYLKATLFPDSLVYNGDDKNNGFYFFDGIAPGNYTVIIEAENFKADTFDVVSVANTSKFYDVWMEVEPDYSVPQVVNIEPSGNVTDVSLFQPVTFEFDIRMDKTSVQNAFSSTPEISGSFEWGNNDKLMTFTPSGKWNPGTEYTVQISSSAQSIFGVSMDSSYQLVFTTRSKLNLVDVYPKAGENNVSTTAMIIIEFDAGIDAGTLSGNVLFLDPQGNFVSIFVDQTAYKDGIIKFEPTNELKKGTEYTLELKEGIGDVEGLKFGETYSAVFQTESFSYVDGVILEDFESSPSWTVTTLTSVTYGINSGETSFVYSSDRKKDGEFSGKLTYSFLDSNAAVGIVSTSSFSMSENSLVGMWVFGNYSSNLINFIFTDVNGQIKLVPIDTLNYTGWKMQSLLLSELDFQPNAFHGIQIEYSNGAPLNGEIYIDGVQSDFSTGMQDGIVNQPYEYSLRQNYPNPFNPSTIISFSLAEKTRVSLRIYNLLGEFIAKPVDNKIMYRGTHTVTWSAENLPSGVYFYRIETEKFSSTKKMILIR